MYHANAFLWFRLYFYNTKKQKPVVGAFAQENFRFDFMIEYEFLWKMCYEVDEIW